MTDERYTVSREIGFPPFWIVWDEQENKHIGSFDTASEAKEISQRLNNAHECGVLKPDCQADNSGLDDGPHLPGNAPRKKPLPKPTADVSAIRKQAWETRRRKYGERGHR